MPRYQIHSLIDPDTGEIVRYTPALADQVAELRRARLSALGSQLQQVGRQERLRFTADLTPRRGDALAAAFFEFLDE